MLVICLNCWTTFEVDEEEFKAGLTKCECGSTCLHVVDMSPGELDSENPREF
jgi:DNA-directed RNA polymerase subunit RPC12/RpoP